MARMLNEMEIANLIFGLGGESLTKDTLLVLPSITVHGIVLSFGPTRQKKYTKITKLKLIKTQNNPKTIRKLKK